MRFSIILFLPCFLNFCFFPRIGFTWFFNKKNTDLTVKHWPLLKMIKMRCLFGHSSIGAWLWELL